MMSIKLTFFVAALLVTLHGVAFAQEPSIPTPPLNSGHDDGGVATVELPIRPTGKYAFLSGFIPSSEEAAVRKSLPFEWIEIEWMIPGRLFDNIPPVDHRLRLHRNGKATYVTGTFGDDTVREGTVDIDEFGRCCLLLEQLHVDRHNGDLGRTVAVSHPLESTLRIKPVDADVVAFRNADRLGDYRFWIIKTVLQKVGLETKWKTKQDSKSTEP